MQPFDFYIVNDLRIKGKLSLKETFVVYFRHDN